MWPPSSKGIGKRFIIPRLILIIITNWITELKPFSAASPEYFAIAMGPARLFFNSERFESDENSLLKISVIPTKIKFILFMDWLNEFFNASSIVNFLVLVGITGETPIILSWPFLKFIDILRNSLFLKISKLNKFVFEFMSILLISCHLLTFLLLILRILSPTLSPFL